MASVRLNRPMAIADPVRLAKARFIRPLQRRNGNPQPENPRWVNIYGVEGCSGDDLPIWAGCR